jgi:hypothetical protein
MSKPLHIISLGAGVQSSTMALMAAHGEITPMPSCAIFADTGAEPQEVYDWLDWLEKQLPFPVYRVGKKNLTEDILAVRISGKSGHKYMKMQIPAFIEGHGIMGRQCTSEFKVVPVRRKMRELAGITGKQCKELVISQWMGISTDEIQRTKVSIEPWMEFRHPLIDAGMSRQHCLDWMKDNGYPEPPRSACTYCPFHSNEEWARMKKQPDEWKKIVQFEKDLQAAQMELHPDNRLRGLPYLHNSWAPIDKIDFGQAEKQFDWVDECEGMCGI